MPPPDRPDEIQFMACHDYSSNTNLGNNNFKLNSHKIGNPLLGNYSSFLDAYGIRNYDEFFTHLFVKKMIDITLKQLNLWI